TYACSSSRLSTTARVVGATCGRPLTTFDTVATDTSATEAIVARVVRWLWVVTLPSNLSQLQRVSGSCSWGQFDWSRQLPVTSDDPRASDEPDLRAAWE